jgi:oxygen-dependent protoporphyrinogen oxidase
MISKIILSLKSDSMTRGIYATSSKNLTVPNTLAAVEKYFMTGIPAVNILKAIGSTDYAFPTKPFLEPYDPGLLNTAKSTKAKVWSLKNGLEDMISKMTDVVEGVDNAEIYLDTSAEVIRKHGEKLSIADSNGAEHHYDQIFASANPKTLSCLLHPDDFPEELIEVLRGFQSTQVYVTLVEMKNMVLPKNPGFGFLVPSCENPDILGVIYDSCNMPEHDGRGARYTVMSTRPHNELPNRVLLDALGAIVDEVHVAWTHQITGRYF